MLFKIFLFKMYLVKFTSLSINNIAPKAEREKINLKLKEQEFGKIQAINERKITKKNINKTFFFNSTDFPKLINNPYTDKRISPITLDSKNLFKKLSNKYKETKINDV